MGPAPGPLEWDHICNLLHKKSFNLHVDNFYDKHQHNINTTSTLCHPISLHCGPHRLTVEVLKNRAPSDRSIRLIWPVWLEMG